MLESRPSFRLISYWKRLIVDLTDIHWVIVGGESGSKARPMEERWVKSIKNQCAHQGISFFFKQWGTWGADGIKRNKKANGRSLAGKRWDEYPSVNVCSV